MTHSPVFISVASVLCQPPTQMGVLGR